MRNVNLTFDIHCRRPGWAKVFRENPEDRYQFSNVRYRVYINDDLITERSWNWPDHTFLKENIWIVDDQIPNYLLQIEPIINYPNQAIFNVDNFEIINTLADVVKINDLQVNFTLR